IRAGLAAQVTRRHDAVAINTVTSDPMAGFKMLGDMFRGAGVGRSDPANVWGNVLQRANQGEALSAQLADQGKKDAYVLKEMYADEMGRCTTPNPVADRILENLARYAFNQAPL
ncbi:MAG: hypothetical protein ACR2P3_03350, partial [Geminicoccaceae bacterium]